MFHLACQIMYSHVSLLTGFYIQMKTVSECMHKSCWFFFSLFFVAFLPAFSSLFPFLPLVPRSPPLTGLRFRHHIFFYIYLFHIFFCLPQVVRPSTSRTPRMDLSLRKGIKMVFLPAVWLNQLVHHHTSVCQPANELTCHDWQLWEYRTESIYTTPFPLFSTP